MQFFCRTQGHCVHLTAKSVQSLKPLGVSEVVTVIGKIGGTDKGPAEKPGVSTLTQSVSSGRGGVLELRKEGFGPSASGVGSREAWFRPDRSSLHPPKGWGCCRVRDTPAGIARTSNSHRFLSEPEASCRSDKPKCRADLGESWGAFYAKLQKLRFTTGARRRAKNRNVAELCSLCGEDVFV
jgi:hypothetical protein